MPNEPHEYFLELIKWLLSPPVLGQISIYVGLGSAATRYGVKRLRVAWANLEKDQNQKLNSLTDQLDAIINKMNKRDQQLEMELLRIQIITGAQSDQLSVAEIMGLYDAYRTKGGNSYITRVVEDYIKRKESKP